MAELRSYARPDIGFLLYAAERVLDGARLYVDVVEINPPLIIALNLPPVLIGRWLDVSNILVYRLGFAAALAASLLLSRGLLGRILPHDVGLRRWVLLLLVFVLFPLSAQDFGQREHLFLALAVPYLLLSLSRFLGEPPGTRGAFAMGLLAGIGFALKPHFLLLWLGVEVWVRLTGGRRVQAVLPESAGIAAVLAAYAAAVLLFAPQYLGLVALLAGPYGRFLYDPLLHLLVTGPGAALVLLSLLAYLALRKTAGHPALWGLLAVAVLACFLAGAAQQKGLRYHFYPSFALAVVLLGVMALDTRLPVRSWVERVYRTVVVSVVATALIVVLVGNVVEAARLNDRGRRTFAQLLELVRERAAGGSLFVMSYHIGSTYPLVNYSGVPSASRFPQLWILAAAYRSALESPEPLRYHELAEMDSSERYLVEAVGEDLRANRPRLLLVLRHARDVPLNGYRRLDYIAYFRRLPEIGAILDRYRWVANVGDYAAYERVPEGVAPPEHRPTVEPGTRDVIRSDIEGLHLRLGDPTFLVALLTFAVVLATVIAVDRSRSRRLAAGDGASLPPHSEIR